MEIDKKRVVQLAACIVTLFAFAMTIPQAIDSHRRYKEEQVLQLKERTLEFSTPATTAEQKAILRAILPTYRLLMPQPKNGEEDKPTYPSEQNSLILIEEIPFCAIDVERLKNELKYKYVDVFENVKCQQNRMLTLAYQLNDDDDFSGLVSDLLKVNKSPWLNPELGLTGIVQIGKDEFKAIQIGEGACWIHIDCWKLLSGKFKNSRAYIKVSRAVITHDKQTAIIYVEYWTRGFGNGNVIQVKNINGKWVRDGGKSVFIT